MDAAARVIDAIKHGKRISGRLVSQIPEASADTWTKKYSVPSLLPALYCEALGIKPPMCGMCGERTARFMSTSKGFSPYCSKQCAHRALGAFNHTNNASKNKVRSEELETQYQHLIAQAVDMYSAPSNSLTLREIAQQMGMPYNRLRSHVSDLGITRTDVKSRRAREAFISEFPQLADPSFFSEAQAAGQTSSMVADTIGVHPNTVCVYARNHNLPFPKTEVRAEHEIMSLLSSHVQCEHHNRIAVKPREIDIFVPSKRLGVEHNGCFWHSELQGRDKNYHISKQLAAEACGVRLIQLWDYEWKFRQPQVSSLLLAAIGVFDSVIYGRDTEARSITVQQARTFLEINHLHGYSASRDCVGLFFNDCLVAVATFGAARFTKNHDVELVRFASLLNVRVVGGLGKLMAYYKKNHNFKSLVSYAHRRLFTGQGYISCGFKFVESTPPGYFWINTKTGERKTRFQTQKHKLNTTMTEVAYMESQGYTRVWDCGQLVFSLQGT